MYDMHCHLIPEVDDGSRSLEESITMIEQYIEFGYKGAIVTPHYDNNNFKVTADEVYVGIEKLKDMLEKNNLNFEIYPGNELQVDINTVKDIKEKKALTLNNSRYVLCELPFQSEPMYAKFIFDQILKTNYVPIIAHAERYSYVKKDTDWILPYIKKGVLIQINLSSFSESRDCTTAAELINRQMVHVIGTDSHGSEWRSPNLYKEMILLKSLIDKDEIYQLTSLNVKKIIKNEYISPKYDSIKRVDTKKIDKKWYKFWR